MAKLISKEEVDSYRFKTEIHVRWSDFDRLGHINNAKYFTYLEQARINYFQEVCQWPWGKYTMVIAHISMDYATPIWPGEQPEVRIKMSRMGTKSFTLENIIVSPEVEGEVKLYAKANTVLVALDGTGETPIVVPEPMRSMLMDWDGLKG